LRMPGERAIAVITKKRRSGEFLALAEEAGFDIVHVFPVRNITSHVLSDEKLEQLKREVEERNAEAVLFDVSLKPKQNYHISKEVGVLTLDRLEVILRIFLNHAPTQEAKLQVKLASLRYELARAKEKVRLAKRGEQPGFYGLGAYDVDVYYEEVQRRVSKILEKLRTIRSRRNLHRERRLKRGLKTVSITGYTCSGKTTLFNALTGLFQRVGDEPFTTLSTKFSLVQTGPWKTYIVDTIGFIDDLPPFMIDAFYSTLEEISFSDVVILVVDVSEPLREVVKKFKTGYNLLIDLEVLDTPIIVALNKVDIADEGVVEEARRQFLPFTPYIVKISALKGDGLRDLFNLVTELLGETVKVECFLPFAAKEAIYPFIDLLKKRGVVEDLTYSLKGISIKTVIPAPIYRYFQRKINNIGGTIRVLSH